MAKTSRCAAPACLSAALLFLSTCVPVLHAQPNGQSADTSKLEKLSGAYASSEEPDVPVDAYVQNGKLVVEMENAVPVELTATSDVEFSFPGPKATARFSVDEQGRGMTLVFSTAADTVYTRIGPATRHVFTTMSGLKR